MALTDSEIEYIESILKRKMNGLEEGMLDVTCRHVASGRNIHTVIRTSATMSKADFFRALPSWLRGTAFGAPFGLIPAGGKKTAGAKCNTVVYISPSFIFRR